MNYLKSECMDISNFNCKSIFVLPVFLILLVTFFSSCKKEYNIIYTPKDDLATSLDKIKKDTIFLNLISNEIKLFSKIDSSAYVFIKKMRNKKFGENELEIYQKILGFNSRENLINYHNSFNLKLNYLRSRYQFDEFSSIQRQILFEETLTKLAEQKRTDITIMNLPQGGPCENVRISCIGSVSAQAVGMHIGCASLDISILGGVACHLSALGYQYVASYNCNQTAKLCIDPKIKTLSLPSSIVTLKDSLKIIKLTPIKSTSPIRVFNSTFIKKVN